MYTHRRAYMYVCIYILIHAYTCTYISIRRTEGRKSSPEDKICCKRRVSFVSFPFCLRSIIALDDRNKGKLKFPFGGPLRRSPHFPTPFDICAVLAWRRRRRRPVLCHLICSFKYFGRGPKCFSCLVVAMPQAQSQPHTLTHWHSYSSTSTFTGGRREGQLVIKRENIRSIPSPSHGVVQQPQQRQERKIKQETGKNFLVFCNIFCDRWSLVF